MKACDPAKGFILIVDDDEQVANMMALTLKAEGLSNVRVLTDSSSVLSLLHKEQVGLVLLDMLMPKLNGRELLTLIRQEFPALPIVMVTGLSDVETVVECMRGGAYDYLVKPVEPSRLIACVRNIARLRDLQDEVNALKQSLLRDSPLHPEVFAAIKTGNKKMRAIFQYVEAVSSSGQPILITGETGVGKELIAHAVHQLSTVKGEFVAVNLAGLDDNMFSDTLFGHCKGAFTGADHCREGLVKRASGGTLFLDEIGDLSPASQVKLLRLLEEREYFPVGSDNLRRSDARIVVASNRNLPDAIAAGCFRSDLYYRLCAHKIELPPLRERSDDIPLLTAHFVEEAARSTGKTPPLLSAELVVRLRTLPFPGNIRELRGLVFDAMACHQAGPLTAEYFKLPLSAAAGLEPPLGGGESLQAFFGHFPKFCEIENYLIDEALKLSSNNLNLAASLLGVTRQTITNRLKARKQTAAA